MTPNYIPYVLPSNAGMTVAFGAGPQQTLPAQDLCTLAQAKVIQAAFGGILVNAADNPSIGTFLGIDQASEVQPWWLIALPSGADGPCGPRVVQQLAANSVNGGGMGPNNTGSWAGAPGNVNWTPTAPPPPVAAKVDSSGDAAVFGTVMGVGQSYLSPAEANSLAHIEAILVRQFGA
jgi:hypothetical protein